MTIGNIVVSPDKIKLVLRVEGLKQLAEEMAVGGYFSESHEASEEELPEMEQRVLDDGGIELTMPLKLKSIGGHRNVIVPEGNGMTLKQDAVIRAIHNARKWTDMLVTGQAANLSDLAKKLGLAAPYVTRILGLANLASDIVEANSFADLFLTIVSELQSEVNFSGDCCESLISAVKYLPSFFSLHGYSDFQEKLIGHKEND